MKKLEKTRRHTTEIVYQKANAKNEDVRRRFSLQLSFVFVEFSFIFRIHRHDRTEQQTIEQQSIRLVKQLREKFNRIAEKTASESVAVRNPSIRLRVRFVFLSFVDFSFLFFSQVNSFVDRRTNGNNTTTREWSVKPPDTLLPRRRPRKFRRICFFFSF